MLYMVEGVPDCVDIGLEGPVYLKPCCCYHRVFTLSNELFFLVYLTYKLMSNVVSGISGLT